MSKSSMPDSWAVAKLMDLAELITKGSSPKWQGFEYQKEASPRNILFITSENVNSFSLDLRKRKYLSLEFNKQNSRSELKRGDLLMNIVGGSIGRAAVYDIEDKANINQAVCLVRPNTKIVNSKWLLYFLNSPICIGYMHDKKVDNARANLSLTSISNFPIPFPPVSEQNRIVAKIESIKNEIEKTDRAIGSALLLTSRIALSMLQLSEGSNCKVGDSFEERVERFGQTKTGSIRKVGVSNELGVMDLRVDSGVDCTRYKWVRRGDIFYNPMRLNVGSVALFEDLEPAVTSPDYVVIRPKSEQIGWLLFEFLKSKQGQDAIAKRTKGSVRERVYFESLSSIPFKNFDPHEIKTIGMYYTFANDQKKKLADVSHLLPRMIDSLLTTAFSGKLVSQIHTEESGQDILASFASSNEFSDAKRQQPSKARKNQNKKKAVRA